MFFETPCSFLIEIFKKNCLWNKRFNAFYAIILSFIPPRLSFEVILLSQIVYNFFFTLTFFLSLYPFSRISVSWSDWPHLNLKLVVEQIITNVKTEKSFRNWKQKNRFKIENEKIFRNWKRKNRFEFKMDKKSIWNLNLFWYFKTKKTFQNEKKTCKRFFTC